MRMCFALLLLVSVSLLGLRCNAASWQECISRGNDIHCTLGPGTTWQPAARLVTGTWLVAGHGTSSFLDLSLMTRASLAPGSRLVLQDLTLVTDIAVARASTPQHFLIPINLTGSGATSIAFSNVTLQLPSTCTTLASYASLLCRGAVNSNLLISRQGVVFRSWTTATVRSSNLKLTCGRPLPSAQHLACMSMVVAEPSELLAALAAAGGQAGGSTTYIHVLRNISLQGYAPDVHGGVVPGPLTNITNTLIISGVPSPATPRPELDWAGWRGIIDAQDLEARVIFQKLVLVNLPLGASLSLPIGLLTASIHFVEYVRGKLGNIGAGESLQLNDVKLLLPSDEVVMWTYVALGATNTDLVPREEWRLPFPYVFQVAAHTPNQSMHFIAFQAVRAFMWSDVQLVSVEVQPPSGPLLIHDTGASPQGCCASTGSALLWLL
ncbi:hypothetical protein V8C86DRAFT_2550277 [Haematococcus lacustris]